MNLNERLAALEKATEENGKTMWRIFEAVYGNGKPGLLAEMQSLRQSVEAHHAEAHIHRRNWQWIIAALISLAAVLVAAFK